MRRSEERRRLVYDLKKEMVDFCYSIGCSGWGNSCPGSDYCSIVRKVILPGVSIPHKLHIELAECQI